MIRPVLHPQTVGHPRDCAFARTSRRIQRQCAARPSKADLKCVTIAYRRAAGSSACEAGGRRAPSEAGDGCRCGAINARNARVQDGNEREL